MSSKYATDMSYISGVKYKDDCPVERYIPIYLIVLGVFGVLRNIVGLYNQINKRSGEENEESAKKTSCEGIIDCFLLGWFIAGNVWVYSHFQPKYDDPSSSQYCDKTLYLFSFGLITASYALVGFLCCFMCLVAFCSLLLE